MTTTLRGSPFLTRIGLHADPIVPGAYPYLLADDVT
jgi:hypothetical protein